MPSPKNHRKGGQEKNRKGRLSEKASSFHVRGGGGSGSVVVSEILTRPRTVPDLLSGRVSGGSSAEDVVALATPPKLTKLLLNVTIQRSSGAVRVVLPMEATAEELIAAAILQYQKEARLPVLGSKYSSDFDLHYSQFSLESLDREEKLVALGSRNFFLCPKKAVVAAAGSGGGVTKSISRCSKEAEETSKRGLPWLKFMEFSL